MGSLSFPGKGEEGKGGGHFVGREEAVGDWENICAGTGGIGGIGRKEEEEDELGDGGE